MHRCTRPMMWALALLCMCAMTLQVSAFLEPAAEKKADPLGERAFANRAMTIEGAPKPLTAMSPQVAERARRALVKMGINQQSAHIDANTGRFETLLPSHPMLSARTPAGQTTAQRAQAARTAFLGFLDTYSNELQISMDELSTPRATVHSDGSIVQIFIQRYVDNVPVHDSYITGVINHGKLNLMSTYKWGDVNVSTTPRLTLATAQLTAANFMAPKEIDGAWDKDHLLLIPMHRGLQTNTSYGYRLVWELHPKVKGDLRSWEVLVDAHSGEVLSLIDKNHYAEAKGGVYPVTNDGVVPDGVEQPGWPMPYMTINTSSGTVTSDTGGNFSGSGSFTASLTGPFVRMNDNCGASSLTQTGGLDFGVSGGTDCTTPGFGGAGNTHSSRSGFYELNRTKEMAMAQLPNNGWLDNQLTSNMNINQSCNAFWNGSTVNFYREGGGCSNTGEIAGVFVHEWGHGMDDNDANPSIASPSGEGIADMYTALRLNDSCIGRNFLSSPCSGNGDPCDTCSGVRDIDYLARQSNQPHTYTWSNANCGGGVHCVGGTYAEAMWNLWKRELPAAGVDPQTAHEITTRLTYIGGGAVGTWFSGGPPNGGCSGTSGYQNFLAADDDDGNINNGTPNMQAIYNAFNTQEIACNTPTVQNSGCSGIPTSAPNVSAASGNNQVALNWNTVAGATEYHVFRAEGIFACDFGKVKVGEVSGTSFTDTNLQNGRDYSYVVIPIGGNDSCMGPASACDTVQPASAPDFNISCSPSSSSVQQGQNANATCTVTAVAGYSGTVNLSCSGNPSGIGCSFSPSSVSPTANSSATFAVNLTQAVGAFNFDVQGTDGTLTRNAPVTITVTPEGQNGPQTATYDAGLGAPRCSVVGSSCDSVDLLDSRSASLSPAEPNASNTLDSCIDGTAGSYASDESNNRLEVTTLDGFDMAEGATVEVRATVYAWNTGTADTLDLYYAADANNPVWQLIGSVSPTTGGSQVLTAQYTLPAGSLQAVRANFRYQGSQSSCSGGTYDDADDLVFAVGGGGPECTVNADCDNGLFCDGAETCNAGSCQAGTAPTCDDGISCTVDSCNEGTDSCDFAANDSLCSNGLFCDGTETCSATLGCQAGTAPNCDDGVSCTVDSCNEGTDSCDNGPDDSLCDNGLFCDGSETCDAVLGCQAGSDPCPGGTCNDTTDTCEGGTCLHDVDFESGAGGWTGNGGSCTTGDFVVGTPDATAWQLGSGNPGQAFFTALNPNGIGGDDVDGGTCEALSPTVNATGQAAVEVSLDYYHGQRDAGDDANDGFTVEVLNNGSVVDTLVSIGDVVSNPVWTNVSTVVNNPGNIQVRVRATDAAGAGDIVEGGIDNVSICPATPASCSVQEDFEGGLNGWFNDGASTCTTGDYIAGSPTNAASGWQITGSQSGSSSVYTADNTSAGVNDVDGGNCILGSPTYSVSNASTLSVWYWHGQRDAGDDATGDFFLLEYSTNGGSSWTAMASAGDVTSNPAWTEATASIPAGSDVQIRVQCSDGSAGGDLVECGIDNVSICN